MSLGEWTGDRFEYGIRASGEGIPEYVGSVDASDHADQMIRAQRKRHEAPGMTVDVVRRKVTYGEWESCPDPLRM